jgi:hypothetical protein
LNLLQAVSLAYSAILRKGVLNLFAAEDLREIKELHER